MKLKEGRSNVKRCVRNYAAGQSSAMSSLLRFLILHSANSHLICLVWVSQESAAQLSEDSPFLHLYARLTVLQQKINIKNYSCNFSSWC